MRDILAARADVPFHKPVYRFEQIPVADAGGALAGDFAGFDNVAPIRFWIGGKCHCFLHVPPCMWGMVASINN
jgi:hypothetical protein